MEEYYRALSHNLRSALKRQLRKLLALGRLELITSMDPEATPALFDLYCSIESRSWKSRTHVAISRDPARVQYFKALLDARQPMQIVIQILLLDGVPIAGLLSGSFCGPTERGLYGLQAAFDRELSAIAPGSIILLLGMRYAILGGYAIFNLLSGFGYYKSRWLAESTSTRSVQIYRIGNLLFWRRLCGNVARYLHLRKELPSRSPFNPLRRSIDGEGNVRNAARGVYKMSVGAEDRAYYEGLVSRARQSKCEFLSTPELLVALEFMKGASMPQMKTRPSDPVRTSSNSC
jgi:hypothetical protein